MISLVRQKSSVVILSILVGCLVLPVSSLASAGESLAVKVMREQFEAECAKGRKPLVDLGEKYLAAARALEPDLQKAGDLEGLLALRNEVQRFEKENSPAPAPSTVASLAKLQKIYVQQRKRALEAADKAVVVAHARYKKKLENEVRRLTVARKVEEALGARSALDQLALAIDMESWAEDRVLHLRFDAATDGTVRDASGTGNHGKLKGNAALKSHEERRGSYLSLDGRGDYVECAHDETLSLSTDGTIALWVRPTELHDLRGMVTKYNPRNSYTFRTSKRRGGTRPIFGDFRNTNGGKTFLTVGEWSHLVVTLANHEVKFYFNGVLDSEGFREKRVPLVQNTCPVRIGSDYGGRYFVGDIDEVRVYRRALTAVEVARIFKAESR